MDRYGAIAAALLACAGCNQVFGIAQTRGPDSDGDGVVDGDDNCGAAANVDQYDGDRDGIGDACDPCDGPQSGMDTDSDGVDDLCDPCSAGANSDEDGDLLPDGCDVCPGVVDDQADADGDGVGDACDSAPGVQNRRLLFDGFSPQQGRWKSWFTTWSASDGSYGPVGGGDLLGSWEPDARVSGTDWWFEAAAVTPQTPMPNDYFGILVRSMPGGIERSECFIVWNGSTWEGNTSGTPVTVGAVARFRFHATPSASSCTVDGMAVPALGIDTSGYVPALGTAYGARFLWVDIVAGAEAP